MFDMKLIEILESIVIMEYSEGVVKKLVVKFKNENPDLEDETIMKYIQEFKNISSKLPNKDITKYNWDELERVVDANRSVKVKAGKIDVTVTDSNLLYNQDRIRLYHANNKKACIKYSNGYSFCIGSRGSDNMYNHYRHRISNGNERTGTPYFIFNDRLPKEDPSHILVIFVNQKIDVDGDKEISFSLTDALNHGDKEFEHLSEIIELYSWISLIKNHLKFIDITPEEREFYKVRKELGQSILDEKERIIKEYKDNDTFRALSFLLTPNSAVEVSMKMTPKEAYYNILEGKNYYHTSLNVSNIINQINKTRQKYVKELDISFQDCVQQNTKWRLDFMCLEKERNNFMNDYINKCVSTFKKCYLDYIQRDPVASANKPLYNWEDMGPKVQELITNYIMLYKEEFCNMDTFREILKLKPELGERLLKVFEMKDQYNRLEKKYGIV